MKDQNVVFALRERAAKRFRISRSTRRARAVGETLGAEGERGEAICLVTGERAPVARLHPADQGRLGRADVGRFASSRSISTPSLPMVTSRATTRPSRRPPPSPTPPRSTDSWSATAATASRSATPRRCSGPTPPTPKWRSEAEAMFAAWLDPSVDEAEPSTRRAKPQDRRQARKDPRRAGRSRRSIPRSPKASASMCSALAPNAARLSVRFYSRTISA